jgi:antirestriction protein ArdC
MKRSTRKRIERGQAGQPAAPAVSREDAMAMLAAGVDALESSEQWQAWLNVASRFRTYSWGNQLLIAIQAPHASHVAGFHAWLKMNRYVRKGEKGIRILAPCVYRAKQTAQESHQGADSEDTAQEPASEPTAVLRGFTVVSVFDVAQTDGEPLPEIPVHRLTGNEGAPIYARLLALAQSEGLTVGSDPGDPMMATEANGYVVYAERRVWLRPGLAMAQRCKTLAHELGHWFSRDMQLDRPSAEVLAESVAYLTMAAAGIDSGQYSFGYLASWTRDRKQREAIMQAAGHIADSLIAGILPGLVEAAA